MLCLFLACSNKDDKAPNLASSLPPPIKVEAKEPIVTFLDKSPKPRVFFVPKGNAKQMVSNKNQKLIQLEKPTEKEANFFVEMQNYNTEQGLPLSSIHCGLKDHFGNLWFGTLGGGACRYDGKTFSLFSSNNGLSSNTILCMIEDRHHNILFGTSDGGFTKYDGTSFFHYTEAQGLSNNTVLSLLEDKHGNIWCAHENGMLSIFSDNTFIKKTIGQLNKFEIRSLIEDKHGNIWIATSGGGVYKYDGRHFAGYTEEDGLANNYVFCLLEDKKGNIWMGTGGGGVSKYDGQKFTNFGKKEGLASENILTMKEDLKGNLWIGTSGGGVSKFDGNSFTNFSTENGLSNNDVWSITIDDSYNIWFGTYGGGICKYAGESIFSYSSAQGLSSSVVRSITEDKAGNLWFGTEEGGVNCLINGKFIQYTTQQGLASGTILSTFQDKAGNLWFGTYDAGLNKFDGKSFQNYNEDQGISANLIWSIKQDAAGNLWFATDVGLFKFDGASFSKFTKRQGLLNDEISCLEIDHLGNIWLGYNEGASKFDGASFYHYTTHQGLANNIVSCIKEDVAGNIWFGTEGGASKFDGKSFKTYATTEGLSDNIVTNIVVDTIHQKLWFGTNLGLSALDISRSDTAQFEVFNNANGFPIKDVNPNALFLDHTGFLWAGTGDKLVRFDYSNIHKNLNPLKNFIQKVKINNESVSWYDLLSNSSLTDSNEISANINEEFNNYERILSTKERSELQNKFKGIQFTDISSFYGLPQNLVLPYRFNNITLEYHGIEPARPFMVQYQNYLEGYDDEWSPPSINTSATFGNIQEGTYTFKLRSKSPEGIWSEPITYTFTVLPPWYRTWWMYVFYIVFVGLVLYFIFQWRTASLRHDKEKLEETVKERTLEIQEKQKEIIDSINYAKRIQVTLLAHESILNENIPQHFVLFKPKDIVSGDFYWATLKENKFYLAVCDSTGHGVPGAFMSLLNISFLNEAITERKIEKPNEIFNYVRERLMGSISKERDSQKDGFDGILICIDQETNQIEYASSYNIPIHIQNENIIELPSDRMPVALGEKKEDFQLYTIEAKKGDMIYLYTDGYPDQFGGEKGKKFKYKPLNELLLKIADKNLDVQKEMLDYTLQHWKGDLEQVDDILMIGIRV